MNRHIEEDLQFLTKCISGEQDAVEAFVRRFSGLVYKFVQQTLTIKHIHFNQEDIRDLHNTVFLQLFDQRCKKLRQFQGKNGCSLASWVRIVTIRSVLNQLRRKGIDAIGSDDKKVALEDLDELEDEEMEPWVEMEREERERLIESGMGQLSPRDQLVIKLHYEEGLSMPEVAEVMKISTQNCYTLKHRAIKKLKSHVLSSTNYSL